MQSVWSAPQEFLEWKGGASSPALASGAIVGGDDTMATDDSAADVSADALYVVGQWCAFADADTGAEYFHNSETGESTWEPPAEVSAYWEEQPVASSTMELTPEEVQEAMETARAQLQESEHFVGAPLAAFSVPCCRRAHPWLLPLGPSFSVSQGASGSGTS